MFFYITYLILRAKHIVDAAFIYGKVTFTPMIIFITSIVFLSAHRRIFTTPVHTDESNIFHH